MKSVIRDCECYHEYGCDKKPKHGYLTETDILQHEWDWERRGYRMKVFIYHGNYGEDYDWVWLMHPSDGTSALEMNGLRLNIHPNGNFIFWGRKEQLIELAKEKKFKCTVIEQGKRPEAKA